MSYVLKVAVKKLKREEIEMANDNDEKRRKKLDQINEVMQSVCNLYSRVAQQLGVTRSFVSRVARGERRSVEVEQTLIQEFDNIKP
jgi:transcriptional regulator with XRE-family HTH domain